MMMKLEWQQQEEKEQDRERIDYEKPRFVSRMRGRIKETSKTTYKRGSRLARDKESSSCKTLKSRDTSFKLYLRFSLSEQSIQATFRLQVKQDNPFFSRILRKTETRISEPKDGEGDVKKLEEDRDRG
jgi:hypothetical protein